MKYFFALDMPRLVCMLLLLPAVIPAQFILSDKDFSSGYLAKREVEKKRVIEGDIIVDGPYPWEEDNGNDYSAITQVGSRNPKWPNATIPFTIMTEKLPEHVLRVISDAMQYIEEHTCLRFVNRTTERDYVSIIRGALCSSNVGRTGGGQLLTLGAGCGHKGTVIHELMHAAGFFHEQSRTDRDEYIRIIEDNIMPENQRFFRKYGHKTLDHLNAPYDYCSIMHYRLHDLSLNGYHTIQILKPEEAKKCKYHVGYAQEMSEIDKKKLNTYYQCPGKEKFVSPRPLNLKPNSTCWDTASDCGRRAERGDCYYSYNTMKEECPRTCGHCVNDLPTTTTTTTTTAEVCEDESEEYCHLYLQTSPDNTCTILENSMRKSCKKSCKFCEP